MRIISSSIRARSARITWLLLTVSALLLLAGCAPGGATPQTASNAPTSSTAATISPTSTTTYTGSPIPSTTPSPGSAQTGCPEATQNVNWSPPPVVVVTLPQSTPAQVKVGDTLEIALKWNQKWTLITQDASVLRLDKPAGYGDASLQSCVWHFTALASGQATIDFTGAPECTKDPRCVPSIRLVHVMVEVSSK